MSKTVFAILSFGLFLSGVANAAGVAPARQGFENYGNPAFKWTMPPNRLHLVDNVSRAANMTEEEFNKIVDDVMKYWQPIAKSKYGVDLVAVKAWKDGTVNASASQSGKTWYVNMYGGLARRPEVTPDGFALVVCHELGHHFGGHYYYGNSDWASAEGESDYFAGNACAKVIWGKDANTNMRWRRSRAPSTVESKCAQVWPSNQNAQGWCVRTAAAGYSLASLLAALGGEPKPDFDKPDTKVVAKTDVQHPRGQCRLDTYFAGALCPKAWDMNVIPSKGHKDGQNSAQAELEAAKYSCFKKEGFTINVRPACWFKHQN